MKPEEMPVIEFRPAFTAEGSEAHVYVDGKFLGKLITGNRRALVEISGEVMREQPAIMDAALKRSSD